MKKDNIIIFRIRKKDKEDLKQLTRDKNIPISEYLYDFIKDELKNWRESKKLLQ